MDRELLEKLFAFLAQRNFILGEEQTVRDMVLRYKQPPMTMLNRVAMQMTINDYKELGKLLEQIDGHLHPQPQEETVEPDPA